MFKKNYSEIIRISLYSIFLLLVFILPTSILINSNPLKIEEFISQLWQIQALLISISFISTSLMQSSFNVRIYGQKVIKTQSRNILFRISSSLLLIIIMSITVWKVNLLSASIVFLISICDVYSNFLVSLNILRKPHMHSEKIKKKILNNLDNFKNFPHNEKLRDEFISCMDYLIDHTKELVHKKNFLEAANNQKLLNHIFKFLICNNINCYLAEYETYYLDLFELRSLYKESERDKLAESIDELLTMDECMNSKHKNKKSPIINIIFSISKN